MSVKVETPISDDGTNFFGFQYKEIYSRLLSQNVDMEIDFIQRKILQNYDHPHILDFCCGHGRHLLKLWQAGFQIDGLDINQDFLAHIEKESNHQVTTFLEDGRDFHPPRTYDVVLNMETSIVYMSDEENMKMLRSMYSCLNEGGTLLLHLANREFLIKYFHPLIWFGDEKTGYALEKRQLDIVNSTIKIEQTRIVNYKTTNHVITMRLYSVAEITNMLKDAGFIVKHIYGDFESNSYNIEAHNTILLCTK
ncbi:MULTISPECIES: cyclopropane-fatty-acyl-phospholipid synthase family protein [Bacillus]|uniref:SAM-dependent methyltransferase n=1 Tax=Bacillus TaxID=1386 RepID=UPI0011A2340D|nr:MULTISPECIES: class I SAM-dependent methyltransferase [Bacillus]MCP1147892.1 methyltransferase domain-containing protein [Bacillus sp. 1735sda2]